MNGGMEEEEERREKRRRLGEEEGGGFVKLQKAKAGEETGCHGERIMELNVWAD